ncbi:MAG: hypothetical protein K8R13_07660 [Methanococcoides sp.]|nr:hypothetical protein [Methanococcoides sp.]
MNYKIITVLLLAMILLISAPTVSAKHSYLEDFNQQYDTGDTKLDSCDTCHEVQDIESINPYGEAYHQNGKNLASIEALDSDGDGFTNLDEINALTFPGDANDYSMTDSETVPETTDDVTEPSDDPSEEQPAEESSGDTADDQKTLGFEMIFAVVGVLAVVGLKKRGYIK